MGVFSLPLYSWAQGDTIPAQKIKEVEVMASSNLSTTLSSSPVHTLTSEDINRLGIQSLADAVRRFPGITVKDYGGVGGFKSVSVRGTGAEYTSVLYDGITIGNAQSGQIDISKYSLDNISVIVLTLGQSNDIFRPAKAFSSAGVLDIQTVRPDFSRKNYQGRLQLKTGSWGLFTPYLYYAHKLNDKFSLSVDGKWQRSDGGYKYQRKNISETIKEKRRNSDVSIFRTELNLYGKLTDNQSLNVKLYYYDSERGIPGPVILYNYEASRQRLWDKDFFVQANYTDILSKEVRFQLHGKYSIYNSKFEDKNLPDSNNRFKQNEYYFSGIVMYSFKDYLSFSLAEDFSYANLPKNKYITDEPERFTSLTAFSSKFRTNNVTIIGSVLATIMGGDNNTSYKKQRLSPTLSISYKPFDGSNLRVRASFKDIFRVPTFNELYYKQVGNRTLQSEKTQQYNLGVTWTNEFSTFFSYFRITGDIYYNNVRDKIITRISTPFSSTYNSGKVDIKGVDIDIESHFNLSDKIKARLSGAYTFQRAIDITSNTDERYKNYYKDQIPFTPVHSGTVSVSIENPWINFGYSFIASDKTYNAPENIERNKIDAYSEHIVSVNKSFYWLTSVFRLQAELVNLTGKTYYIIKDYPMPGRAFRLVLNIDF